MFNYPGNDALSGHDGGAAGIRVMNLGFALVSSLNGVIGASGGVGQLCVRGLCTSGERVRALVRDSSRAATLLPPSADLFEIGSLSSSKLDEDLLREALTSVTTLYIAIGTTAFPTKYWFRGDTPRAVEINGVKNLLRLCDKSSLERIIYISSIGTSRSNSFPFWILNLFGILDVKRTVEELIQSHQGTTYAIVHPGRLIGGPHTDSSLAAVLKLEKTDDKGIQIFAGDDGMGDCCRSSAAKAALIAGKSKKNLNFSVVEGGHAIEDEELQRWIDKMTSQR